MKKTSTKKSLVIVESPAKAKTINKYLGPGFDVKASIGHIRDLPSKGLNVDIENNFEPTYDILPGKKRTVNALKAAAKKADNLYLATDLDREGEAIAWHLAQILDVPQEKIYRVIFNAITKTAIQKAFTEPGRLDMDKVMAQQARRILDRIVGYKISPLLWKKVARGLSAGRVQSVAVKILVERERKIREFEPQEYWLMPAVFTTDLNSSYTNEWENFIAAQEPDKKTPTLEKQNQWFIDHHAFRAELDKVGGRKFEASNKTQAQKIFDALKDAEFKVAELKKRRTENRAVPPFITSTMQQAASSRMGYPAKRTMRLAQQLYEGIDLGSMGTLGLITYMRTDSTHLAPQAISEARKFIEQHFGPDYLPKKALVYTSRKSAQQAHEAVRPTDVDLTPKDVKQFLTDEQYRLYDLIWRRFLACQMSPAKWEVTDVETAAATAIGDCRYKTTGKLLLFDGFSRLWPTSSASQRLPNLTMGQQLDAVQIKPEQHFTKPPPRYSEASLIKALEKQGIGRPSTYAAIISTIQDRKYVEQTKRRFYATDLGEVVTDKLNDYFPRIMDIAFTRYMEEQLDKIEEQHLDWLKVLKEFYDPFKKHLQTASEQMKHAKAEVTPSDYNCPSCGKKLVYRFGKNGRFLSCSDYPNCKFSAPCDKHGQLLKEEVTEYKCQNCGKPMVKKTGRYGPFLGCSGYPECKTILNLDKDGNPKPPKAPPEPTGIKCYKCKKGELVIRKSRKGPFLGCNGFPRCRTIVSIKKLDMLKQLQEKGDWPPKTAQQAEKILGPAKRKKKKTPKK